MRAIYKFFYDCGREGILEGIFTEESENVSSIYGETINFGEVLGKHSDIICEIDIGDINLITNDKNAVEMFEKYQLETGYNPFVYLSDEEYV